MSVRYPVAANPEAALAAPLGRAARERDAEALAGEPVGFVRELSGPAFDTQEAASSAYRGRVDAPGGMVQPEDRYCELMEVVAPGPRTGGTTGQAQPVFSDGRRWPEPRRLLKTVWRLSVGYWRPLSLQAHPPLDQARQARRTEAPERFDAETLRRMARQPMQAVKPQQPLDIGLFETTLPENPQIVIPDE
jgi:hypothetical protein